MVDTASGEQVISSNYEPMIGINIKGAKEVFKPIKNDRDLGDELSRI